MTFIITFVDTGIMMIKVVVRVFAFITLGPPHIKRRNKTKVSAIVPDIS